MPSSTLIAVDAPGEICRGISHRMARLLIIIMRGNAADCGNLSMAFYEPNFVWWKGVILNPAGYSTIEHG